MRKSSSLDGHRYFEPSGQGFFHLLKYGINEGLSQINSVGFYACGQEAAAKLGFSIFSNASVELLPNLSAEESSYSHLYVFREWWLFIYFLFI